MFGDTAVGLQEIHVFPLVAMADAIVFAGCSFAALADGAGEGMACHIEWLRGEDGALVPVRMQDLPGCAITDHWNADCPDFTAEGFSAGNADKLATSLGRSFVAPADLQPADAATKPVTPRIMQKSSPTDGQPDLVSVYRDQYFEAIPRLHCIFVGTRHGHGLQ